MIEAIAGQARSYMWERACQRLADYTRLSSITSTSLPDT